MSELIILQDLVVIFFVAVLVVAGLHRIGVPTIAGFILTGILVGPGGFGLVGDIHQVEMLAEIGVALLLFGIGLEIPLTRLRRLWRPVVLGGALQVSLTATTAGLAAAYFNFPLGGAIFLGFLVAVSSTAIVLRGLAARGESAAPHGQFTLGILLFQDLCVVPMMLAIPILAGGGGGGQAIALALLKTFVILSGVVAAAWFVVPRALHFIAGTRERDLFVLTMFLTCIGTAWLISKSGVSLALGAFFAGLVVAGSEYRHQALSDLIPFREVLTSLFFVSVGMLLDPSILLTQTSLVVGLVAAIILGKFLIVVFTGTVLRIPLAATVLSAAALSQVGEFSFVLLKAAEGTSLVPSSVEALLLSAAILSMLLTPLLLNLGPHLAAGAGKMRGLTGHLNVPLAADADARHALRRDHTIIAGYGVTGRELAVSLREAGVDYLIVDLNPINVRRACDIGEPAFYGDITSSEVLAHLGTAGAREMVISINDPRAAERGVAAARRCAPTLHIVARSRFLEDVEALLKAGANKVVPAELEAALGMAEYVLERHDVPVEQLALNLQRIRRRLEEKENLLISRRDPRYHRS